MEIILPVLGLILGLIWAILNIILFFKLWGACNDIRRIADKIDPNGKDARIQAQQENERKQLDAFLSDN